MYTALNNWRQWFNTTICNYELILEDDWYKIEGITTIEYDLCSLETKELLPLAQDTYLSHQDAKGVWHLGDYQRTEWLVEVTQVETLIQDFFDKNGMPVSNE